MDKDTDVIQPQQIINALIEQRNEALNRLAQANAQIQALKEKMKQGEEDNGATSN